MGFITKYYQTVLKKHIMYSLSMVDSQSEGGNIGQSELQKKKRAKYPNERINQCNDLAQMTKDVKKWLMMSAVTCWKRG